MSKIPERFIWAASLMNIQPHHHILEIGCGAGLLAKEICSKLSTGKFKAIDKSASMIAKAEKRNKGSIETGKASFAIFDFKGAKLTRSYYDKVVAFNVNFFRKDSILEFKNVMHALKPTGKLFIFYQAPFEININAVDPIKQMLAANSFEVINTQIKEFDPTSAVCVIAKPAIP